MLFKIKSVSKSNLGMHWGAILWVVFFCYSICAGLVFQKLVVPKIFPTASGGLLPNDSASFHYYATVLAEQINVHGWSVWSLYPNEYSTANVAILGALYAVFGYDPALMIPINAALHALSGLMVYLIAREISSDKLVGICAGAIAAVLFIIFPSALNWYGQIHKDGFAIAGSLIVLFTWLKALKNNQTLMDWLFVILLNFTGVLLVLSVRPYNIKLMLIANLGALLFLLFFTVIRRQFLKNIKTIFFFIFTILLLLIAIKSIHLLAGNSPKIPGMGDNYATWQGSNNWQWQDTKWVPDNIEGYVELAASTRAALIDFGVSEKASSTIDQEIKPENLKEVLRYLPRALQIALFAPFPSTWFNNLSLIHIAATIEMTIYYLCIPGVLLLLAYSPKPAVFLTIYFACFFLTTYGFTTANVGTLYRLRYAYEFLILLLGVMGWMTYFNRVGLLQWVIAAALAPKQQEMNDKTLQQELPVNRKKVITSGLAVMAFTLLGFIAFFLRDVLMARTFGLDAELDSFFIALLIPMFIVTVFCMPLGAAFIPVYLKIKESGDIHQSKVLVSNMSLKVTLALAVLCSALYLVAPSILGIIYPNMVIAENANLLIVVNTALLILFFSGMIILGNSVLNAHGRAVLSSISQLIVPMIAILALYLFGATYGVLAVVIGMVIGQFLNLLIVQYFLRQDDVNLMPFSKINSVHQENLLINQYVPLTAAAFFAAVTLPISTLLAMTLPNGAVSAFNLGSKIVLFITGLVSAVVTTVVFPYFSSLIAKNRLMSARRELSFFMLLVTFISVPISAVLFIWADFIVKLLFGGGQFDAGSAAQVVRVMQYAVVQIPFFICNTIILKFATATRHVALICVITILSLLVNVGASLFLTKHMGVAGLALGSSVSVVFATALLVLALVHFWHISKFDALVIFLNWILFLTLLMCLHFKTITSVYAVAIAYLVLLLGYLDSLKVERLSINWWRI